MNAARIVDALKSADNCQDVFEALRQVPICNLEEMGKMIRWILKEFKKLDTFLNEEEK